MQNLKGQAINARFFEAVSALIQTREVNSFLTSLVLDFKVSSDWLLTGRGKMK